MKKEKEKYKLVLKILAMPLFIQALFEKFPKDSTIPKFRRELRKYGFRYFRDEMDHRYFCHQHLKETKNIVLRYYDNSINYIDKFNYLGCLYGNGDPDLFDFVLDEFIENGILDLEERCICDLLCEMLYTTKNIKYKDEYIKYLKNEKGYHSGQYINPFIKICGHYRFEEAHEAIRINLKYSYPQDRNMRWQALKNYNDKEDEKLLKKFPPVDTVPNITIDVVQIDFKDKQAQEGIYPSDSTIPVFIDKIKRSFGYDGSINDQEFCHLNNKNIKDLVLKFYKDAILSLDQRYYLRCLNCEANDDLYPFLIKELKYHWKLSTQYHGIVVSAGSYFSYAKDKKNRDKYLKVFLDETLPVEVRFYILIAIVDLRLPGLESAMLKIINDDKKPFCYMALKYLSRSKQIKEYKEIFDKYKMCSDGEMRSLANNALKKIDKTK